MEKDFLQAFNKKNQSEAEPGTVLRPFISCPTLLSLAERQELTYRYQYLEETFESLGLHYRLSPIKIENWVKEKDIQRVKLESEEDIIKFEAHVNNLYKSLQVRLIGLAALNTAKTWQNLAAAEEDLLQSLKNAAKAVSCQECPDPRMISTLASTHALITSRHELIQKSMENAGNVIDALKEQTGWDIQVTHVENKPKSQKDEGTNE